MHVSHPAPAANPSFNSTDAFASSHAFDPRRRSPDLRMLRYGWRHDPLRIGEDTAPRDRRPGDARPLPSRPVLCAGRSDRLEEGASTAADAPARYDPPAWARSIWEDTGVGGGRRGRSVLRAAEGGQGDLQAPVGQSEDPREELLLAYEVSGPDCGRDIDKERIEVACLIVALLGFALAASGIVRHLLAGWL